MSAVPIPDLKPVRLVGRRRMPQGLSYAVAIALPHDRVFILSGACSGTWRTCNEQLSAHELAFLSRAAEVAANGDANFLEIVGGQRLGGRVEPRWESERVCL